MSELQVIACCSLLVLLIPAVTGVVVTVLTHSGKSGMWSAGVTYASALFVFSVMMIIYPFIG